MKKALCIIVAVALLGIAASTVYGSSGDKQTSIQPAAHTPTTTAVSSVTTSAATTATTTPMPSAAARATVGYRDGTYQGADYTNRYGDVQVSITIQGGKITAVNFDSLHANDTHSAQINNFAAPDLQSQTLSAQSAQIDGVSGATFTTNTYIRSLQSALDKAAG